MLNKRGMSPLIATVLLMAFAVALGGMIMNYTGTISSTVDVDCSGVSLDVVQFCYDDTAINIRLRNTGEEAVAELSLNIDNPDTGQLAIKLADSQLNKGAALTKKVPFYVTEQTGISLIASLAQSGETHACPSLLTKRPMPKC